MWVFIAGGLIALADVGLLLAWALLGQASERLTGPADAADPLATAPFAWRRVLADRLAEIAALILGVVGILTAALVACVVAVSGR